MEKNCILLCLWIKWSSKLVLWLFRNFHHWTVTKVWFQLPQFSFTYLCLTKSQLTELQDLGCGTPKTEESLWRPHTCHRVWRLWRTCHSLFCDVPFISLFDSDVEFILAHEQLSQQPLQSIHMSIIKATIRKLVTASIYWVLAMCHAHTAWNNLIQ